MACQGCDCWALLLTPSGGDNDLLYKRCIPLVRRSLFTMYFSSVYIIYNIDWPSADAVNHVPVSQLLWYLSLTALHKLYIIWYQHPLNSIDWVNLVSAPPNSIDWVIIWCQHF